MKHKSDSSARGAEVKSDVTGNLLKKKHSELKIALLVYLIGVLTVALSRMKPVIPIEAYQLLDPTCLQDQFFQSLWYLHSQPPVLNALLGIVLAAERITLIPAEFTFFLLHMCLGVTAIWAHVRTIQYLISSDRVRIICIFLIVLNPAYYVILFEFFYTIHEFTLLALIPYALIRLWNNPNVLRLSAVCLLILLLVYTRSLFHFLWALVFMCIIFYRGKAHLKENFISRRLGSVWVMIISVTILFLWPLKNYILFESFTFSSWQGCNFAKGLDVGPAALGGSVPDEYQGICVLAEEAKSDGSQNFNHFGVVQLCKAAGSIALTTLIRDPQLLVDRISWNYWSLTRYSGRNPWSGKFGSFQSLPMPVIVWMRTYERVFTLEWRSDEQLKHRLLPESSASRSHISGLGLLIPFTLVATLVTLLKCKSNLLTRLPILYMFITSTYAILIILMVDGDEGNRIRLSSEPYLMILFFWSIERLLLSFKIS